MPWETVDIMKRRKQFIAAYLTGKYDVSALCRSYNISRKTGYKWIERFKQGGYENLVNRSSAPKTVANRTPESVCDLIVKTKSSHQYWGPKKILDYLKRHRPEVKLPADSTAGEILKRHGWVRPRNGKRCVSSDVKPFSDCNENNQKWSVDFKGHFKLGNGNYCYPLTISDNHSRFLLECRALKGTGYQSTREWMEWTFREYGLPKAILSDNGGPFASMTAGGISHLSRWWIELGISPERIQPGCPQQNGRHERMHRTLKEAVKIAYNFQKQQKELNAFRLEYNEERSHESLGRRCPSEVYSRSPRTYPEQILEIEYGEGYEIRRVRRSGEIKWQGRLTYISQVLSGARISLEEVDNDVWEVCFGSFLLGRLSGENRKLSKSKRWHKQIEK